MKRLAPVVSFVAASLFFCSAAEATMWRIKARIEGFDTECPDVAEYITDHDLELLSVSPGHVGLPWTLDFSGKKCGFPFFLTTVVTGLSSGRLGVAGVQSGQSLSFQHPCGTNNDSFRATTELTIFGTGASGAIGQATQTSCVRKGCPPPVPDDDPFF